MSGLLGDTTARNYSEKLHLFSAFAERELRHAIGDLRLRPGMRVLDAGCGAGESLGWFHEEVKPEGAVVGLDLAEAHATSARARAPAAALILQADLLHPPLAANSFDLVWCVNTVNHLRDPDAGLSVLRGLLRPRGRIALGQTGLLPDMVFAWDARLERVVNEAVRQYSRDKYELDEEQVTAARALVGLLRRGQFCNVQVRTLTIDRVSPLCEADERYLLEVVFRGFREDRLKPYLAAPDLERLRRLCDPQRAEFALRRADFHFLQTFTLAIGEFP